MRLHSTIYTKSFPHRKFCDPISVEILITSIPTSRDFLIVSITIGP
uniref:Uncharacterized protein n=1 Tax=Lepeophtheirus salmonis TaxID=72036 RepID=A0A0K2U465_LEPSM